jgi:DNA-binding transcriptional LysR family regulator
MELAFLFNMSCSIGVMIFVEIRQLKTFISIVKLGSFSQTARFLGYTQSTVTTQIKLLERELNTMLFERLGPQLMLTTDGEKLYSYAEQIVNLTEEAKNQFDNAELPMGSISIGMPETLCVYHLTDLLKEYAGLYPDVEIKLRFGVSGEFQNLLRKNVIDIAFLLEKNIKEADLIEKFLWSEPLVMVVSPRHHLAKLETVVAKDLQQQTFVFTDAGSSYLKLLTDILAKFSVMPRTVLEICQIETIKKFVISNLGITILPLAAVKAEISAGTLTCLKWQGPELKTNAYLVYHKDKWLSHAMRAFIKLIDERLLR